MVSTCNRVEVYAAAPNWARCGNRVLQSLAQLRGVPLAELQQHTFVRGEQAAASRIFRVAASLKSMVVGEPQILGQVKERLSSSRSARAPSAACSTAACRRRFGRPSACAPTEIARGRRACPRWR